MNRLRIGIGPVPGEWDAADFVLGKFDKDERPEIDEMILRAADGVELLGAAEQSTRRQVNEIKFN